jgi:hypothetical protein
MALTSKCLCEGTQLGTAASTLYTAPANTIATLKKVTLTNTSAGALTYTLYAVPTGGTAGPSNTIASARNIAAGQTVEVYDLCNHVLNTGDSVQGLASGATAVSIRISGFEQVLQ